MTSFHSTIDINTEARVSFTDVTDRVIDIVKNSGITEGIVLVYSQHTTCSVLLQEASHDVNLYGTDFLLQDSVNVLEQIIPTSTSEGQYLHPGPMHLADAESRGEEGWWSLNVDAHLRSVLLGRSESVPLVDGSLLLGEFGRIYFADFDQVRARPRTVRVHVVG